ncbi:Tyrosine/DOPA decarboxylase 2 [Nymphaea thermarum]|nr:Tyrosine/DOPA decarboxylase 2 [Nymphaea thermarum]
MESYQLEDPLQSQFASNNLIDPEEFRKQAHLVVDFLAHYYRDVAKYPVLSQVEPGYLRKCLPDSAPDNPESIDAILKDVVKDIIPGITHWQSPNYFAYFPSSGSTAGFIGEMLSTGFNVVGFNWMSSPAATELESIVMDWLGRMLSLPDSFMFSGNGTIGGGGVLQGTTCEAILCTLVAARDRAIEQVGKHDIAYAGSACVCSEFRHFIDGVEDVNSFSMNAHKWFFTNLDCCCLWVRNHGALVKSLSANPEYLRNKATESKRVIDYKDWQIALSRRFRVLKLWLVLCSYGVTKIRNFIRSHVRMAKHFEILVAMDKRFEFVVPRKFAMVCFRLLLPAPVPVGAEEACAAKLNQQLLEAVGKDIVAELAAALDRRSLDMRVAALVGGLGVITTLNQSIH